MQTDKEIEQQEREEKAKNVKSKLKLVLTSLACIVALAGVVLALAGLRGRLSSSTEEEESPSSSDSSVVEITSSSVSEQESQQPQGSQEESQEGSQESTGEPQNEPQESTSGSWELLVEQPTDEVRLFNYPKSEMYSDENYTEFVIFDYNLKFLVPTSYANRLTLKSEDLRFVDDKGQDALASKYVLMYNEEIPLAAIVIGNADCIPEFMEYRNYSLVTFMSDMQTAVLVVNASEVYAQKVELNEIDLGDGDGSGGSESNESTVEIIMENETPDSADTADTKYQNEYRFALANSDVLIRCIEDSLQEMN